MPNEIPNEIPNEKNKDIVEFTQSRLEDLIQALAYAEIGRAHV